MGNFKTLIEQFEYRTKEGNWLQWKFIERNDGFCWIFLTMKTSNGSENIKYLVISQGKYNFRNRSTEMAWCAILRDYNVRVGFIGGLGNTLSNNS